MLMIPLMMHGDVLLCLEEEVNGKGAGGRKGRKGEGTLGSETNHTHKDVANDKSILKLKHKANDDHP